MTQEQGATDPKVIVSVSEAMANLRAIQTTLNGFWQTSELAYGFFLSHSDTLFANKEQPTFELLGYLETMVWYPNHQGKIKHKDNIGGTLDHIRKNTVHIYRATLLSFYSAFEAYLDQRLEPEIGHKAEKWGPFFEKLAVIDRLKIKPYHIKPSTIVLADFAREIRNKFVHEGFSCPEKFDDPLIPKLQQRYIRGVMNAGWISNKEDAKKEVGNAVGHFFGSATDSANKKKKPIELFYMLYSFTNLNNLAYQIEEALLPHSARTGYVIEQAKAAVNRLDLIVEQKSS